MSKESLVQNLEEIKKGIEVLREKKARAEERLKALKEEKKALQEDLKKYGVQGFENLPAEIERLRDYYEKKREEAIQFLEKVKQLEGAR